MPEYLHIAGAPATGKSSLFKTLIPDSGLQLEDPMPHLLRPGGVELGRERDHYRGMDALKRDIVTTMRWWFLESGNPPNRVICEGDKAATPRFWTQLEEAGWKVHVYILWAPDAVLDERIAQREAQGWKHLSEVWMKGQRSRYLNMLNPKHYNYYPNAIKLDTSDWDFAFAILKNDPIIQAFR